jgi:betaine reductase
VDPTFAGSFDRSSRWDSGLYHICEQEVKKEFDPDIYEEQVGMMEMVLDVEDIAKEMQSIRDQYSKFH